MQRLIRGVCLVLVLAAASQMNLAVGREVMQ